MAKRPAIDDDSKYEWHRYTNVLRCRVLVALVVTLSLVYADNDNERMFYIATVGAQNMSMQLHHILSSLVENERRRFRIY